MKRSRNLKLTLMAALPAAFVTGCGSEPETGVVLQSASDCYQIKKEQTDIQQCLKAYDEAVAKHQQAAPRFTTRYECDAQFGSCTAITTPQGQQSWIPPMGGFLLGYALGNMSGGGYRYGGAIPLYRDYRSGGYYKPNGDLASDRIGTVRGRSGAIDMPTRAITVSRSGFGSSAAARSSFGSGGRSAGFGG
ncbi:DUF1190 domain-containing protein [Xanthomonas oryzae pv. oryzicola]|uniref:Lipoprotein, putative n=1 Tax=Xanthomonas oryzae pv. oryzicola (strain BLS256) TaxID=383407 RepID=G7TI60_XANOB|nr:DUF1190 domain-containing protein [Xanthomonas oryzae]AEQ95580.1 lipoprotein, putative [Xanthomonas oryzae pv. oryzicola BLS256]AJQ88448.1 hypothetical protein BE73_16385 [Xanthomonas oryzae pv. oryzicola]AKK63346.1 hypothetical protein FE36_05545 [Xanthomonas oryzae pv. oryzicola]AKO01522.1 lipoprotein [Xanthomonas oryzae pv. oryzicola]AKO05348.1 lipoprotein [Xanthomonas oryzae pv. oryzicola]